MRSIRVLLMLGVLFRLISGMSSNESFGKLRRCETSSESSAVTWASTLIPSRDSFLFQTEKKQAKTLVVTSNLRKSGDIGDETSDLESLYKSRAWFELRDAIRSRKVPGFYRGAVACAFGNLQEAREQFRSVIESAPKSEKAYQSRNMLAYFYSRTGQYHHALEEINQMLVIMPDNASDQAGRKLYAVLSQSSEQVVTRQRFSRLPYELKIGNPFIPVSVNGKSVKYMLDTGANFSILCESEAKLLGLTFHDVPVGALRIQGSSGARSETSYRVAIAEEVTVGTFGLRNVAFLVTPDEQEPWTDLQPGERGALGISVLYAFRTMRWSNDGTFEIGFASKRQVQKSNVCFQDSFPVVQAVLSKRKLELGLDTGAAETHLSIRFAKEFAELLNDASQNGIRDVHGIDGNRRIEAVTLQEMRLQFGGFMALLRPARVLLNKTNPGIDHFHGLLGWDLLSQARRTTLDFESMMLSLE